MTDAIKVPIEWLESIQNNSGGAQWVIKNPRAGYWHDVYVNSIVLYRAIEPLDTSLQNGRLKCGLNFGQCIIMELHRK